MARKAKPSPPGFFRRNGLTVVLMSFALVSILGQAYFGYAVERNQQRQHGEPPPTASEYLGSGPFLSAEFENWESEFLQMGLFVLLTVSLRQQGSSESRPLDPAKESPEPKVPKAEQPWPMRVGGIWEKLYAHSLSSALLILFCLSFALHWYYSWQSHVAEQLEHGGRATTAFDHLTQAQFWFESFQNWQSEFLSVAVLCVLSIWLREKDSPQSKKLRARYTDTGAD